jgi:DUF1680 family protein
MHPRLASVLALSTVGIAFVAYASITARTPAPADKVAPVIPLKAVPFDLTDVRLLDGPFRDAMLRDKALLLGFDEDRLLRNFRVNAGLPTNAQPLGGWEAPNCELRGHFVGHYLSACSLMYASTGDPALKQRVDSMVAELAKCQDALPSQGYHPGYLSAFPETLFDRVDASQPVWAPYYTLHKIMAGLYDAYEHCSNQQALAMDEKIADWLWFRVSRLPYVQFQASLRNEQGGMNEVLANLYAATGRIQDMKLSEAFDHEAFLAPLAAGQDKLDGIHANTQIPKIIGVARQYELSGAPRSHQIAEFFWDRVAMHRSWVIGGHSDNEHFFPVTDFYNHLSPVTAETCNTYNMLKLTRHLFEWDASAQEMDFYERGLFNQILASQDPATAMVTYFIGMKPGAFKVYSTPLDSFWCCMGTGIENHAKYGDTIYFHAPDALYVNLFIASTLQWTDEAVTLRQETQFPNDGASTFTIHCGAAKNFALMLRHPAWAGPATVSINGKPQPVQSDAGSYYINLSRTWHDGDTVEYHLPMSLHLEPLPGHDSTVAVMYGPIVLAGELGSDNLPPNGQEAKGQQDFRKFPLPLAPVIACAAPEILSHIERVPGKELAFKTNGLLKNAAAASADLSLLPFYRIHHEHYSVYWDINPTPATASR